MSGRTQGASWSTPPTTTCRPEISASRQVVVSGLDKDNYFASLEMFPSRCKLRFDIHNMCYTECSEVFRGNGNVTCLEVVRLRFLPPLLWHPHCVGSPRKQNMSIDKKRPR